MDSATEPSELLGVLLELNEIALKATTMSQNNSLKLMNTLGYLFTDGYLFTEAVYAKEAREPHTRALIENRQEISLLVKLLNEHPLGSRVVQGFELSAVRALIGNKQALRNTVTLLSNNDFIAPALLNGLDLFGEDFEQAYVERSQLAAKYKDVLLDIRSMHPKLYGEITFPEYGKLETFIQAAEFASLGLVGVAAAWNALNTQTGSQVRRLWRNKGDGSDFPFTLLRELMDRAQYESSEQTKAALQSLQGAIEELANNEKLAAQIEELYPKDFIPGSDTVLDVVMALEGGGSLLDATLQRHITKPGQAGLDQLKTVVRKFRSQLIAGSDILEDVRSSAFLQAQLRGLVRYDSSQFGSHDLTQLSSLIDRVATAQPRLKPGYEPSKEVAIGVIDSEAAATFAITDDARAQYRQIIIDLENAFELESRPEYKQELAEKIFAVFGKRAADINKGLGILQGKRQSAIESGKDKVAEKLAEKITEQQAELDLISGVDEASLFDLRNFYENFEMLSDYPEATPLLRTVLFASSWRKHRSAAETLLERADQDPGLEDLTRIQDFVSHLTHQEVWKKKFVRNGLMKALDSALAIKAIDQDVERSNSLRSANTRPFTFVPTRGLLLELSGHMGDACWASKYGLISEQFPNVSSVSIFQNPGTADERVAGSMLLIEGETEAGEELLIVRGINPIENVITQLDQASFYGTTMDYLKTIAAKTGRRLAVVIDGHSGGSATNRQKLFAHLSKVVKPQLKQVGALKSEPNTTFNGYLLDGVTYFVN